jgi:hypothetical protein
MRTPENGHHAEALLRDSPARPLPSGASIIEMCKTFIDLLGELDGPDDGPKTPSAAKRREALFSATVHRSYELLEVILATECSNIAEMQARAEAFRVWIRGFHPTFASLDELAKDGDPDWCDRFAAAMSRDLIALHPHGGATGAQGSMPRAAPRLPRPRRSIPGR